MTSADRARRVCLSISLILSMLQEIETVDETAFASSVPTKRWCVCEGASANRASDRGLAASCLRTSSERSQGPRKMSARCEGSSQAMQAMQAMQKCRLQVRGSLPVGFRFSVRLPYHPTSSRCRCIAKYHDNSCMVHELKG